jgi:hypothetical protein
VSCLVGVVVAGLGARAIARPSRPFKVESLQQSGKMLYVNTSRRLGGFYVLAGVVWIIVTLSASAS